MLVRKTIAIIMLLLMIIACGIPAFGAPTLIIKSPANNSILLTKSVNVTGTAAGSDAQWSQTSQADFNAGSKENISSYPGGNVSLNEFTYDDFNDNSLDPGRWSYKNASGVNVSESAGMVTISGTSTTSTLWLAVAEMYTMQPVTTWASADLKSFSGSGGGYNTVIALWQSSGTEAGLVFEYDSAVSANTNMKWIVWTAGVLQSTLLGVMTACPHTVRLDYIGGILYLYLDGSLLRSGAVNLVNPKIHMYAAARAQGNTVSASWDNIKSGYAPTGCLTSAAFDTLSADPVLKRVSWNADVPSATGVIAQIRSSDQNDMSSPTSWVSVTNGQIAGLPVVKRYLQYKMSLASIDGYSTPVFNDITIDFHKPVKNVEVSIDGQASWIPATGKEKWYALLELPENETKIWVRVTDVAGDSATTSITVDVDTTPPRGSIVIDDGNNFALSRNVVISCNAQDNYGVRSLIVSEDTGFSDAEWTDYHPTVPFVLSDGDGAKNVYAKFKDIHGWESALMNDTILLDTTPPNGSVLIDGGAKFTRNTTVAIALNATDMAGISEMKVSDYKDLAGEDWQPFKAKLSWDLPLGNGERTVYASFRNTLGQESAIVSDSIILDAAGPSMRLSINGGSAYTNSTSVSLRLNATDNYRVNAMEISEDPSFSGSPSEPYSEDRCWTLTQGDGVKKILARATDAAGNVGLATSATITMDTTAPVSAISQLPFTVNVTNFTVGWNGTDAFSGIQSFDLQYRDGEGAWTDWLRGTNSTKAVFTGTDGHTYSFRARAQDRVGNTESFPDTISNTVSVRLPPPPRPPVVSIVRPIPESTLKGNVNITGTSYHPEQGMKVKRILVQIDGGPQQPADGTDSWTLELDTTQMVNGRHTVVAQAFDGTRYSNASECAFFVKNQAPAPSPTTDSGLMLMAVLLAVILVAAGITTMLVMRKKRPVAAPSPYLQRMPAPQVPPVQAYVPAHMPVQPPPVPASRPAMDAEDSAPPVHASGKMAVIGKISVDDLDDAPAPKIQKTAEQKQADAAAAREGRILKALSSLPRGLPSSLWGMDMDELAANVASAEERTSEQGDRLVKIGNRWFYGDERNLGLFLQEYKK